MISTTINDLVFQHLLNVAPEIAAEFRSCYECDPKNTKVSLKDIVSSYNNTIFANSLVYKHLCKVSPNLVKNFKLHHTPCEESLDNIIVLYEKINSNKNDFGARSKTNVKVEKPKDEVFVEGEFSDTDLLVDELEKYYPCFASSESESEIDDDISVLSQEETPAKIKCMGPAKNKLVTELPEENVSGFCHILDCEIYKDLQERLSNDSILDKLASHILNKNILVRKIHQTLAVTNGRLDTYISREILTNKNIKFGFFNIQENSLIETNWKNLLEESHLSESTEDVLDIFRPSSSKKTKVTALKCNVIGLYLSKGMTKVRYTSDVFEHAKTVLAAKSRTLSPEEKDFLVEYVDKHGEDCDWRELAYILYKKHVKNGVNKLKHIYSAKKNTGRRGRFKLEEDQIILDFVFSKRGLSVNSDSFKEPVDSFKQLATQLDRSEMSLYFHWNSYLKPLLLRYHAGTLNLDIKRLFLNYLNDKEVIYLQDIQWAELLSQSQFAGHTRLSLTTEFNIVRSSVSRLNKCNNREVIVPQMVDFVNDNNKLSKRTEENVMNGKRSQQLDKLLKYYESLVNEAESN